MSRTMTMETLVAYVSEIIQAEAHNVLDKSKHSMVSSRLSKRMLDLGQLSCGDYYDYLNKNLHKEVKVLLSLMTTHHTFFFREFIHFEFLARALPDLVSQAKARGTRKIRILSCACSKGQEAYSLVMFLNHHLLSAFPDMDFEVVGTDIDPKVVSYAENGVYPMEEVKKIPHLYLADNWQRGTGKISEFAKIKNHLKRKTRFTTANILKIETILGPTKFDVIFCRNVFIYFAPDQVLESCNILLRLLHPNGYLITGVSESLKHLALPIVSAGTSVYQPKPAKSEVDQLSYSSSRADSRSIEAPAPVAARAAPAPATQPTLYPKPIKVAIVDDSGTVRKVLSKIFEADPDFQVVGTATDGVEAHQLISSNQVDAITLDIHMPNMDGVEYLSKHFGPNHPKVVVVSSASRDDGRYAQRTLQLGASDFVEKPEMSNLGQRGEEIKNKIKMAFLPSSSPGVTTLDTEIKKDFVITNPHAKGRLFVLPFSQLPKAIESVKSLEGIQPPVFFMFEGNNSQLEIIRDQIFGKIPYPIEVGLPASPNTNSVYLLSSNDAAALVNQYKTKPMSVGIIGGCTAKLGQEILGLSQVQLLLEDTPLGHGELQDVCDDLFPVTSFPHVGTEYLARVG